MNVYNIHTDIQWSWHTAHCQLCVARSSSAQTETHAALPDCFLAAPAGCAAALLGCVTPAARFSVAEVAPVAPPGVTVLAAFLSSAKALLPSVTGVLPSVSPLLPEALPSVSWDLPSAMGSSLIALGWVMPWEERAAAAASAGDS